MKKEVDERGPVVALVPIAGKGEPAAEVSVFKARPDLASEAEDLARGSLAENSHRALRADWKVWTEWCASVGVLSLPATADTAAAFLAAQSKAGKAVATLDRYRASVSKHHRIKGYRSPFDDERAKAVMAGIRRRVGVAQDRKAPATIDLAESVVDVQDRALLFFGLATAFRRSEIVAVDVEDLTFVDEGIIVLLRKSKTDQERQGRLVPIPRAVEEPDRCPVAAVETLLQEKSRKSGPLFIGKKGERLRDDEVADAVKRAAVAGGLDPSKYAGHSLRAGFVTFAWEAGFTEAEIMSHTGHKKVETVRRYIRSSRYVNPFQRSLAASIWKKALEMSNRSKID